MIVTPVAVVLAVVETVMGIDTDVTFPPPPITLTLAVTLSDPGPAIGEQRYACLPVSPMIRLNCRLFEAPEQLVEGTPITKPTLFIEDIILRFIVELIGTKYGAPSPSRKLAFAETPPQSEDDDAQS